MQIHVKDGMCSSYSSQYENDKLLQKAKFPTSFPGAVRRQTLGTRLQNFFFLEPRALPVSKQ